MLKLLADENISLKTVTFIREAGFDIVGVREIGQKGKDDKKIVNLAKKENRIIVTFDLDFGEIYYFSSKFSNSIIVMRTKSQSHENINPILLKLIKSGKLETEELEKNNIRSPI